MTSDCPFVRAAFLDVVSICGKAMLQRANTISIVDAWKVLTTSITIGPEYEIGPSDRHGDALLRKSLAQVYMIDRVILRNESLQIMVSDEHQTIGDALMLLANKDPDTCLEALETLDTVLQMKASHDLTVPLAADEEKTALHFGTQSQLTSSERAIGQQHLRPVFGRRGQIN